LSTPLRVSRIRRVLLEIFGRFKEVRGAHEGDPNALGSGEAQEDTRPLTLDFDLCFIWRVLRTLFPIARELRRTCL